MGKTPYGQQVFYAYVDAATAATHEIIPATTGMSTRIVSLFLRADEVVTVQFLDGATAIGGTMQMTDGDIIMLPLNEYGWFETTASTALNMSLSGAKQVSGWVGYMKE